MHGSYAAGASAFHGLPLAMFTYVFGIVDGAGVKPVS
jgi:hypothetical protein